MCVCSWGPETDVDRIRRRKGIKDVCRQGSGNFVNSHEGRKEDAISH